MGKNANTGGDERIAGHPLFSDLTEILRRSRLGVREALIDHRLAGNPVAVWRDGEVLTLDAGEILESDGGRTLPGPSTVLSSCPL